MFYSLDPSRRRLSGAVGRLLIPKLMKRYQTEDERELEAEQTAALFRAAGWETQVCDVRLRVVAAGGAVPGMGRGLPLARRLDDAICGSGAGAARQQLRIIARV